MTTVELESVSMGPLSDMLEQWWAHVEVTGDGFAPTRARVSLTWSPATNKFTPDPDNTDVLDADHGGRAATEAEVIDAFVHSPARDRAYAACRQHARRHRDDFPERVALMQSSR